MKFPRFRLAFAASLALIAALGCRANGGGGGVQECTRNTQCPSYVCNCADGTSVQRNSCSAGSCRDAEGLCEGCSSRGGATGPIQTVAPEEGNGATVDDGDASLHAGVGGQSGSNGGTSSGGGGSTSLTAGSSSGGNSNGGNSGSSNGGNSNGGSSSDDPPCDQIQEETGCYEPIVIQKGSLTMPGVPCDEGLSECGEECPGQNMWCCPTGYTCAIDDLVVRALCQDESESLNIMCVPPDVKRCNYTPQEALDHLSRHDLGCIQHLGDGVYYGCDIHGPQSQTKCVAAWDPNSLGEPVPICPDQASSCVPTAP